MNLEGIILREVSETDKEILYDFTYMWHLKNKTETDSWIRETNWWLSEKAGVGPGEGEIDGA